LTTVGTRLSENALETALVAGRSRVRRSRAIPPVRFVHPRSASTSALVFSSALGGGMLEGDDYRFQLDCRENSTLMFAPQANTRIFPCPGGTMTRQSVRGTVYANGLAVCGGDPVVPYAGSRFSQSQHWVLHPEGRLVILDWMIAGRLDRGEGFAFDSFESNTRVEAPNGRPLLCDAVFLNNGTESPVTLPIIKGDSRARRGMGGFSSWMALHVLGPGWEMLHAPLEATLRATNPDGKPFWMEEQRLAGLGVREGRGFSMRALGVDRSALEPLAATLFGSLARPGWLGFDFWSRKY
jgi:urease accessory protein UreH